jgi:hypothetical protein
MHCTIGVCPVAANDFAPAIVRRVRAISICATCEIGPRWHQACKKHTLQLTPRAYCGLNSFPLR